VRPLPLHKNLNRNRSPCFSNPPSNKQQYQENARTYPVSHTRTAIMADGIDRKADERMEFSTSKDVTVIPTFSDMHLKGTGWLLCRMINMR
jgi:hypothetical protein